MKMRFFAMLTAVITIAFSCGKDKEGSAAYPKNVGIEYRVTSPGLTVLRDVTFTNATGGISMENDIPLPFSRKFNKTVNQYEVLTFNAGANGAGLLKMEILINGKVTVSKDFTGTTTTFGLIQHNFN